MDLAWQGLAGSCIMPLYFRILLATTLALAGT